MRDVVDVVARLAEERWGNGAAERQDVAWRHRPTTCRCSRGGRVPGEPVRLDLAAGCRRVSRRAVDRDAQAGVAAPEGAPRPGGAGAQAHRARPRPGHGVRGRRLPEPVGVLGRRHGDVHGARRALHAGVRVLPRRHPPTGAAGCRRTGARRRGDRPHGPRPRRAHDGRPRRPARRWHGPRRRLRRGDPAPPAGTRVETLVSDVHGPTSVARRCCSRSGRTCSTTTWRRWPGCSGRCARRPATPAACPCSPGPRRRADDEVRAHRRDGRDRRRGRRMPWPTSPASASTSSRSASTCARRRTTCRSSAGSSRRVRRVEGGRRALGIGHVEASPLTRSELPRQVRRRPESRRLPDIRRGAEGPAAAMGCEACTSVLDRVRKAMAEEGVDVLLLSVGHDLPYLTGYEAMPLERLTMFVVPRDGDATLVVPRLEAPRVVDAAGGVRAPPVGGDRGPDGDRRRARGGRRGGRRRPDVGPLPGRPAAAPLPGTSSGAVDVVGPLRMVKDDAEIAALRAAGAAADRVARQLQGGEIPLVGRTEAAGVGRHLGSTDREGHHKVNFAIVAAGENAASPHHHAGDRVIPAGEIVLCDFGGTMDGYCSDITRCVFTGAPPAEIAEAYAVLHEAQQAASRRGGRHALRGRRPRRSRGSSPTPATASTSSTAPATASAWKRTRTRTSSRATAAARRRPRLQRRARHLRRRAVGHASGGHRRRQDAGPSRSTTPTITSSRSGAAECFRRSECQGPGKSTSSTRMGSNTRMELVRASEGGLVDGSRPRAEIDSEVGGVDPCQGPPLSNAQYVDGLSFANGTVTHVADSRRSPRRRPRFAPRALGIRAQAGGGTGGVEVRRQLGVADPVGFDRLGARRIRKVARRHRRTVVQEPDVADRHRSPFRALLADRRRRQQVGPRAAASVRSGERRPRGRVETDQHLVDRRVAARQRSGRQRRALTREAAGERTAASAAARIWVRRRRLGARAAMERSRSTAPITRSGRRSWWRICSRSLAKWVASYPINAAYRPVTSANVVGVPARSCRPGEGWQTSDHESLHVQRPEAGAAGRRRGREGRAPPAIRRRPRISADRQCARASSSGRAPPGRCRRPSGSAGRSTSRGHRVCSTGRRLARRSVATIGHDVEVRPPRSAGQPTPSTAATITPASPSPRSPTPMATIDSPRAMMTISP